MISAKERIIVAKETVEDLISCPECEGTTGTSLLYGKLGELLDLYWNRRQSLVGSGARELLEGIHRAVHNLNSSQARRVGVLVDYIHAFLESKDPFTAKILASAIGSTILSSASLSGIAFRLYTVLRQEHRISA